MRSLWLCWTVGLLCGCASTTFQNLGPGVVSTAVDGLRIGEGQRLVDWAPIVLPEDGWDAAVADLGGPLTRQSLRGAILARTDLFWACLEAGRAQTPDLSHEHWVELSIDEDGAATGVEVEGAPGLTECFATVMASRPLPSPKDGEARVEILLSFGDIAVWAYQVELDEAIIAVPVPLGTLPKAQAPTKDGALFVDAPTPETREPSGAVESAFEDCAAGLSDAPRTARVHIEVAYGDNGVDRIHILSPTFAGLAPCMMEEGLSKASTQPANTIEAFSMDWERPAKATEVRVMPGTPTRTSPPLGLLRDRLKAAIPRLAACYRAALIRDYSLVGDVGVGVYHRLGELRARKVVLLVDTVGDVGLASCIEGVFGEFRFPVPHAKHLDSKRRVVTKLLWRLRFSSTTEAPEGGLVWDMAPRDVPFEERLDAMLLSSDIGLSKALSNASLIRPAGISDHAVAEQLAASYTRLGRYEDASAIYRDFLIEARHGHADTVFYAKALADNALALGRTAEAARHIRRVFRLVDGARNGTIKGDLGGLEARIVDWSSQIIMTHHRDAQRGLGLEGEAAQLAESLYAEWIRLFAGTPSSAQMRYFHAELLYGRKNWRRAVVGYNAYLRAAPRGQFAKDARSAVLLCYQKLLKAADLWPEATSVPWGASETSAPLMDVVGPMAKEVTPLSAVLIAYIQATEAYLKDQPGGREASSARTVAARLCLAFDRRDMAINMMVGLPLDTTDPLHVESVLIRLEIARRNGDHDALWRILGVLERGEGVEADLAAQLGLYRSRVKETFCTEEGKALWRGATRALSESVCVE